MRKRSAFWAAAACAGFVAAGARPAQAYQIHSTITAGCHEQITGEALRIVRRENVTAATPLPSTRDDAAMIADLQFPLADDQQDLAAAALLLGVRDNDLKGRSARDLTELADIHGNPAAQEEHCLRSATQKEPDGSRAAVDACRAYIKARATEAIDALGASGGNTAQRMELDVYLAIQGKTTVSLPAYYVKIGQATHALEDSFAHTFRTPDGLKITVVLDWLDLVSGRLDESRDGPPHLRDLDKCDDADALRSNRHVLAITAVAELLRATLDSTKSRAEKLAAVDVVIDRYVSYSPGCTFDNQWCNAAENQYSNPSTCAFTYGRREGYIGATIGALAVLLLCIRRRRTAARRAAGIGAMLGATLYAGAARAQEPATESPPPASPAPPAPTDQQAEPKPENVPPPPTTPVKEPGPRDPDKVAFGVFAGGSGSIDRAAFAGQLGLRLRATKLWTFGLDGEYNPFIAIDSNASALRQGTINAYGSVILRFPLAYEKFNLRTRVSAGTATLLDDLVGAPKGTTGIFFGIAPLALELKASRAFYFVLSPIEIAVPAPQLTGVPFLYPQYRTSLGLEFYTGGGN